ncbi:hypothetical protein, partial [Nostoc linckia]
GRWGDGENNNSSVNSHQLTIISQQSSVNSHQSSVNSQQSSVTSQQSTINNQHSSFAQLHKGICNGEKYFIFSNGFEATELAGFGDVCCCDWGSSSLLSFCSKFVSSISKIDIG